MTIDVLIPAYNEEASIGQVLDALPRAMLRRIVVADNNSRDATADVARSHAAEVVPAPQQGYGSACLAAMAAIAADPPDVVVFIDADFSDHPEQLPLLVAPILEDRADFVIGSRTLRTQPAGSLMPQQRFGNWLACFLMRLIFRVRYSDLGPFRAIRYLSLKQLEMSDPNYGWTIEMQIKAARQNIRTTEVAIDYRPRIGQSKISGTLRGSFRAGCKILYTIWKYRSPPSNQPAASRGRKVDAII